MKKLIKTILLIASSIVLKSQNGNLDTIILTDSKYEKIDFTITNNQPTRFEIIKKNLEINDGRIEKYIENKDTLSIKLISQKDHEKIYLVELSNSTWSNFLYNKHCIEKANEIKHYPKIEIKHSTTENKLSIKNHETIGNFIHKEYLKRIDCQLKNEIQKDIKYLERWIKLLEKKELDTFIPALLPNISELIEIQNLHIPQNEIDTLTIEIKNKNEIVHQYTTEIKTENENLFIYIFNEEEFIPKKTSEEIFQAYENSLDSIEIKNYYLRLDSFKNLSKSTIELDKTSLLKKYYKVIETKGLNQNLKAQHSLFNYEIKKIITSNT